MIEKEILIQLRRGQTIALITIIEKSGSAPRLPGSKMFVGSDGAITGTIGGGRMEHTACATAVKIAAGDATPVLTEIDMRGGGTDGDSDMICGGIQLLLIERITPDMVSLFEQALACFADGARGGWLIDISVPKQPLRSFLDMRNDYLLPGVDCRAIIRGRYTRLIQTNGQSLVFDPLPRSGTVVLFGGGHVSKEVAWLASAVDFDVVVCDDRLEFSNTDRFPMARATHVFEGFKNLFERIEQGEDHYLLIITRGHCYDQEVLAQALRTPARYIGMIGSRRKRDICYGNLRDQGFGDADFTRVHCPIGLPIGSETPREIAVSIIAELIAARAGAL